MVGCKSFACLLNPVKNGQGTNGPCTCLSALDSETKLEVNKRLRELNSYKHKVDRLIQALETIQDTAGSFYEANVGKYELYEYCEKVISNEFFNIKDI